MSISERSKYVGSRELADLIALDAESLRRIADRVDIKAPQISGYLVGRAYLGNEARGRLYKGLGLTTAGRISSRRTYSWFLGADLEPLHRLLDFIFRRIAGGNAVFEAKLILNQSEEIPVPGQRGQCDAYAIRGMGFRAKLFRFKYSNVPHKEAFDPNALGGEWSGGRLPVAVRLDEEEWERWCQSISVEDFDVVFNRNSPSDRLDLEHAIRDRGWTFAQALAFMDAEDAREKQGGISNPQPKAEGEGK